MKRAVYGFCLVLGLFTLGGCHSKNKLPQDPLLSFLEIQDVDIHSRQGMADANLYSVYQFFVRDSLLITRNSQGDHALSVYNRNDQTKKDFVRKGRGPGEVISLLNMAETADGLAGLDGNNKRIADIRIVGDSATWDFIALPDKDVYTGIIKGRGFVILTGLMEDGRYLYYDPNTNESKTYCSYPVGKEYENSPDFIKNRIMISSSMTMKPDQTKFACVHYNSGIIDICRIENGGIERHKLVDFYYPKVSILERKDDRPSVAIPRDFPNGFMAVQCDDRYIYTLYSGKTFEEHGTQFGHCDYLLVFDWDGNPTKAYHLEMPLTAMYWNEPEQMLYGLTIDDEEYLVTYQL